MKGFTKHDYVKIRTGDIWNKTIMVEHAKL